MPSAPSRCPESGHRARPPCAPLRCAYPSHRSAAPPPPCRRRLDPRTAAQGLP
ncbi:hypothetical protein EVA_07841 [gut metagenome]|uniref:Uncharacterized protein n=1 Tax=gut metagenome TaxID=749906 RepID=J9GUF6_9ZZZZ